MHGLQALAWCGLWARPLRTVLTTFGVALEYDKRDDRAEPRNGYR